MESTMNITKTLVCRNTQISYSYLHNEGKETIVMLHPAFADHTLFDAQVEDFKNNYQIILMDLPGHGSCQLKASKVTMKEMPEILNQILDDNGIEACHLLGVSMGSLIAQAFADRYPDRTKSVIIVGGYSIHKANKRVLQEQKKEGLKWLLYMLTSMKKFRNHVISVSCSNEAGRNRFARGIQYFRRSSFSSMAGMNTFFIQKAEPMPYPLLIIVGEHDLPIIKEASVEWNELEVRSQMAIIPGAGHCANADAPQAFYQIAESFLSAIVSPVGAQCSKAGTDLY